MRACSLFVSNTLITMALLLPPSSSAQELPQPGERVRYWLRPCDAAGVNGDCATHGEGSVLSVTTDSIQLSSKVRANSTWLAVHDIARLERHAGRKSAFWRGAAWGAVAGGTVGIVVGIAVIEPIRCGYVTPCGRGRPIVAGGGGGAFYGAVLGGIVGAIARRDRWQPVVLDHVSVRLFPMPQGRVAFLVSRSL